MAGRQRLEQSASDALSTESCPSYRLLRRTPVGPEVPGEDSANSDDATEPAAATARVVLTPNCTGEVSSDGMETVNALELRQSLGKVLDQLEHDGKPILVCRRRAPAAALVSLKDYRERFADGAADDQRRDVVAGLKRLKFNSPASGTTLDILRDLRS